MRVLCDDRREQLTVTTAHIDDALAACEVVGLGCLRIGGTAEPDHGALEESGRFARDWVAECQAGQPSFKAMRRMAAEHPIEQIGEKLRGMMPWIAKNKLVDKARN